MTQVSGAMRSQLSKQLSDKMQSPLAPAHARRMSVGLFEEVLGAEAAGVGLRCLFAAGLSVCIQPRR